MKTVSYSSKKKLYIVTYSVKQQKKITETLGNTSQNINNSSDGGVIIDEVILLLLDIGFQMLHGIRQKNTIIY